MSDQELIEQFATSADPGAFAELVRRHVDWVNSLANRLARDRAMADDVTQAVFILLCRKSRSLRRQTMLSNWLFAATRYCVRNACRTEANRRRREKEVAAMRQEAVPAEELPEWKELSPILDELVGALRRTDREAVLLRFYQDKTFAQIGAQLQLTEEAARKRVSRSIEFLRGMLERRGVTVGATALAAIMSANLTAPASAAVVAGVTAAPMAGNVAVGTSGIGLFWTSLKPVAVVLGCLSMIAIASVALLQQDAPAQSAAPARPTIAPANLRYGRVLGSDDKPAAGAKVWLMQWSMPASKMVDVATTTADADGRFSFPAINEYMEVFAQSPDHALGGGNVRSRWPDEPSEIRLLPKTSLRVRLLDPDGKPASGIKLTLGGCGEARNGWRAEAPRDVKQSATTTTDADGYCTFTNLPQGGIAWLDLLDDRFARMGFYPWFELNDAASSDVGEVRLKPAASISGKVVFAGSGKPAAGVKVMATSARDDQVGDAETLTDEQGRYALKQLRASTYCVFLFLSEDMSHQAAAVALENLPVVPGTHLVDQDLTLVSGGIVRGKILSATTGKPLSGIGVFVDGPSRPSITSTIQEAKSDKDGVYYIHVPPGPQRVQLALPMPAGFARPRELSHNITVSENQVVDVDYALDETPIATIQGRAVDPQGRPLAGVDVYVQRKEQRNAPGYVRAQSDEEGRFTLESVEPTSLLRARRGKWSTLEPVAATGQITLTLHPDILGSVRVVVQQRDGKPIPGAKLELNTDDGYIGQKPALEDGSGIFRSLAPDMNYKIVVRATGFGKSEARVNLQPGRQVEVGPIVLTAADSFVGGMVVDDKGDPVPDVRVGAESRGELQIVKTDISGMFKIPNILPGDLLRIVILSEDRGPTSTVMRDVAPGTANLVLTLPAQKPAPAP